MRSVTGTLGRIKKALVETQARMKAIAEEFDIMGERLEGDVASKLSNIHRGRLANSPAENKLAALRILRKQNADVGAVKYDINGAQTKVEIADIAYSHIRRIFEKLTLGSRLRKIPGLPPTSLSMLVSVARLGGATAMQLAEDAAEVITGNLQTIRKDLAKLEKAGLVEKQAGAVKKTARPYNSWWRLTDAGKAVVGGDLAQDLPTYAAACTALAPEERGQLARLLQIVTRPDATGSTAGIPISPEVNILSDLGRTVWSTHPGKNTWTTPRHAVLHTTEAAALVRFSQVPGREARMFELEDLGFTPAMVGRMVDDSFRWLERVVRGGPGELHVPVRITDQGLAVAHKLTTDPIHSRAVPFVADFSRLDIEDARQLTRLLEKLANNVTIFPTRISP